MILFQCRSLNHLIKRRKKISTERLLSLIITRKINKLLQQKKKIIGTFLSFQTIQRRIPSRLFRWMERGIQYLLLPISRIRWFREHRVPNEGQNSEDFQIKGESQSPCAIGHEFGTSRVLRL